MTAISSPAKNVTMKVIWIILVPDIMKAHQEGGYKLILWLMIIQKRALMYIVVIIL